MRYRRVRRAKLTPRQIEFQDRVQKATIKARILCAGVAKCLEKVWDVEEFGAIQDFLNTELTDAFRDQKAAEVAFDASQHPPRSRKSQPSPKAQSKSKKI